MTERRCREVRFETRRCVKMRLRPGAQLGELTAPPRPYGWIWRRNGEEGMETAIGKENRREGKEGEGKEDGRRNEI